MKQERNNNISLTKQIDDTKQNIHNGEDTYPIDIIETRQIHYELPGTVEVEPVLDWGAGIHMDEESRRMQRMFPERWTDFGIRRTTGSTEHDIMSIQKNRFTPDKKVYLVEINDIKDSEFRNDLVTDEEFIIVAKEQEWVFTLDQYVTAMNENKISMVSKYIRII